MADPKTLSTGERYISKVNRILDYIEHNLGNPLTLEELSQVANLSPWHLHRIFTAVVGESLRQYIIRLRLERSAKTLQLKPNLSITQIALDMGFAHSAAFSKAFKERFKCSPRDWKTQNRSFTSSSGRLSLREGFDKVPFPQSERSRYHGTRIEKWLPTKVAYVRYIGPYAGESELFRNLYQRLISSLVEQGISLSKDMKELILYHDDPNITSEDKLRVTVCLSLEGDNAAVDPSHWESDMGCMEIPGGWYSCSSFSTHKEGFAQAWDWVYSSWLPQSGWEPDDRPCFEWGTGEPARGEDPQFHYDICIALKK